MKANLQIILHGREYDLPIELDADQINRLISSATVEDECTGWEKPERGEQGFYEDALGRIQTVEVDEDSQAQIDLLYQHANLYSSKTIAKNIARGDRLIRELRRFAVENRVHSIDREGKGGYTIMYNYQDKCLECGLTGNGLALGDVLFETEELAREAINKYAEELIWYFTEKINSLRN